MSLDNETALRFVVWKLVAHKRRIFAEHRQPDGRASGYVGLGSSLWSLLEALAPLADCPQESEDETILEGRAKASELLKWGLHPPVCAECNPWLSRTPDVEASGPCCFCGEPASERLREPYGFGFPWDHFGNAELGIPCEVEDCSRAQHGNPWHGLCAHHLRLRGRQ